MPFQFDDRDKEIMEVRQRARDLLAGPRMGDYVRFATGELERLSHDWGDEFQTSPSGSFYLEEEGLTSLTCGALNPATPRALLEPTDVSLPGAFWFFHHGQVGAGRAVYFRMPCKLYRTTAPYTGYLGRDFQSEDIQALRRQLDLHGGNLPSHVCAGAA